MDVLSDYGLVYMKRSMKDGTYATFADSSFVERWESLAASLALAGEGSGRPLRHQRLLRTMGPSPRRKSLEKAEAVRSRRLP